MAGEPLQRVTLTGDLVTLLGKPCRVLGGEAYNADAATRYVQLFDATSSASVTLGTTPNYKFLSVSSGDNDHLSDGAISFGRGIVAAATTGPTNATGATAVHLSLTVE